MKLKNRYGLSLLVTGLLPVSMLLSGCDSGKISVNEAKRIIQESQELPMGSMDSELVEITPPDVWAETKSQLFRISGSSSMETYIVADNKAAVLGNGFGGFGVTSAVPFDANGDGTIDLVYAYSFGSGMHRSVISWMDLSDLTEHNVNGRKTAEDEEKPGGFRTYDLILTADDEEIVAHRIENKHNREETSKALFAYPTAKDIESMTLIKDSVIVRDNQELYNERVDEE